MTSTSGRKGSKSHGNEPRGASRGAFRFARAPLPGTSPPDSGCSIRKMLTVSAARQGQILPWCVCAMLLAAAAIAAQPDQRITLAGFLEARLPQSRGGGGQPLTLKEVCPIDSDPLAARIFREYGAMFAARDVTIPPKCIFGSEKEVAEFQSTLSTRTGTVGGVKIELQTAAMEALLAAQQDAAARRVAFTPRGGATASKRSFADTRRLWDSRFLPGLEYWLLKAKITRKESDDVKQLPIAEQVRRVLDWESKGMYFSTGKNRTILSSVGAPGTSQHLSALALDVAQFESAALRSILNKHGWYQTVVDDTPHFTYIGVPESELPQRGLVATVKNGYRFWIPVLRVPEARAEQTPKRDGGTQ